MFSHKHTRTTLLTDRTETNAKLSKLKTENQDSDRTIKNAKLFTSNKDKAHKEMRDVLGKLDDAVEKQDKQLQGLSLEILKQTAVNEDKDLEKRTKQMHMDLKKTAKLKEIELNTSAARIEDLNGQIEMATSQLQDIQGEKLKVDRENTEMEHQLQGKGFTDKDQKAALEAATVEQTNRLEHSLIFLRECGERLNAQLREEETLAR